MASTATRMLLLGAVQLFEPVNGYQIRRELLSWRVDEWAHTLPGSIYTGLDTLAKQGMLTRHHLVDGSRTVSVYVTTEAGRVEFQRLYADAIRTIDQTSNRGLNTALALQPLVPRTVFLELLRERLERVEAMLASGGLVLTGPGEPPPHLPGIVRLWTALARTERTWLRETLAAVAEGAGEYAGEPTRWTPPDGDPGWAMVADRARYRAALGLS